MEYHSELQGIVWRKQDGPILDGNWNPPRDDWLKLNVDNAFSTFPNIIGCGRLIQDPTEMFRARFYTR